MPNCEKFTEMTDELKIKMAPYGGFKIGHLGKEETLENTPYASVNGVDCVAFGFEVCNVFSLVSSFLFHLFGEAFGVKTVTEK
jgi:hypothetical protein